MADGKKAEGLALIFGGKPKAGAKPSEPDEDDMAEEDKPSGEFDSAYAEYEANPSKDTFWRAVKACMEGGY
jgi:hypothetical protein